MSSRRIRIRTKVPTGNYSQWNVQVSVRTARFCLVLGRAGAELARLIAEEESETDNSFIFISLEYISLRLCHLPQGHMRTARTLEIFFDFLILVADFCIE